MPGFCHVLKAFLGGCGDSNKRTWGVCLFVGSWVPTRLIQYVWWILASVDLWQLFLVLLDVSVSPFYSVEVFV